MTERSDLINKMTRQAPFDINDVVKWTNRLLPHIVSAQSRYKVAEEVTIRIVRYYLTKALISKPDGYMGRNAQFGSRHVIQILAIKYLQAQYIPLKKIAQMMASTSEAALLSWLQGEGASDQAALPSPDGPAPSDYVGLPSRIPLDGTAAALDDRTWRRYPIHPDIELHLASGFNLFDHQPESNEILTKIMQALTAGGGSAPRTRSKTGHTLKSSYRPARAIKSSNQSVIALVTEGGLVPIGNPDGLPSARSTDYKRYSIEGLDDLKPGQFESIDRGWDNTYVNEDPDRLVPLDVMREFESRKHFNRLHQFFFSTTGVGTTVENARRIGQGIVEELKAQSVSAVLLTAT